MSGRVRAPARACGPGALLREGVGHWLDDTLWPPHAPRTAPTAPAPPPAPRYAYDNLTDVAYFGVNTMNCITGDADCNGDAGGTGSALVDAGGVRSLTLPPPPHRHPYEPQPPSFLFPARAPCAATLGSNNSGFEGDARLCARR